MEEPAGSAPMSVLRLLRSLAAGTAAGRVRWLRLDPLRYRFNGPQGWVLIETQPPEDAPISFSIYDADDVRLEWYEAPTRFSEGSLDNAMIALWQAIIARHRGDTVEPVIESLIEAAGGDVPAPPEGDPRTPSEDLDDLPF